METLLTEQHTLYNWLENLEQNIGKRNESDRQPAAIERHSKFVKEKWDNFESNHEKLKSFEDNSDDYFTQGIFDVGKSFCNKYLQLMANMLTTGTVPKVQKSAQQTPLQPITVQQADKVDDALKQDPNEDEDRELQERQWGLNRECSSTRRCMTKRFQK